MATADTPPPLLGFTGSGLSTPGASDNEEGESKPLQVLLPQAGEAEEGHEGLSSGGETEEQAFALNLDTKASTSTVTSASLSSTPVTLSQAAIPSVPNPNPYYSSENICHPHSPPLASLEYRNPSCTTMTDSSSSISGENPSMDNQADVHQNPRENLHQVSAEKGREDICEWEMVELGMDGTMNASGQFYRALRGLGSPPQRLSQGIHVSDYERTNFISDSFVGNSSDYNSKVSGFYDDAVIDSGFPSPTCELG